MQIVIVTPALADANNGNWQTARRWARFLSPIATVRMLKQWPGDAQSARHDDVMLALHARRSATSIANWHAERGNQGLGVVLTGTDLYRDILDDTSAQRSLEQAQALVVLQELGSKALPAHVQPKARVIFQSTTARQPLPKSAQRLRVVMVGHLREEKSPHTLFAAARLLKGHPDIHIDHIGVALDPALGDAATHTMREVANYRWLGGLGHEAVRRRIQRAHVLVHASRMEGGAHVIMEAVLSGTPVLASQIDGNIGMLGADYSGYFPWDDAPALAALIRACRSSQQEPDGGLLDRLARECRVRAHLFLPAAERMAVQALARDLSGETAIMPYPAATATPPGTPG